MEVGTEGGVQSACDRVVYRGGLGDNEFDQCNQTSKLVPRPHHTHLCTEGEVQSQVIDDVLKQVAHALVERVILSLQIREVDWFANDVLVEGSCEEAVEKLVVGNGLCNHATHKLEVLQVVWIDM